MASLNLQVLMPGSGLAATRRPRPEQRPQTHLQRRRRRSAPRPAAASSAAPGRARPPAPARASPAPSPPAPSAPPRGADLAALFASDSPSQAPAQLRERFGVEGYVEFYTGEGGLPLCFLHHPSGHSVEVYLQGASVTRWLDAGRRDLLMPRPDAVYRRGAAIK